MKKITENMICKEIIESAVKNEKEDYVNPGRVDSIMNSVMELSLQASFESQRLNYKTAFIYGVSIAVSICVGCIIGNLFDITSVPGVVNETPGIDFISVGLGGIFLPI
ncbi:MAG: hypothetical protein AB9922_10665 [Bacteroidales bacterium]